ncbi:GntR family transcriptional regulator [Luteithermobacter gelatinilyticus]|uniref:GntR family transcriptional regulator n=1 Tax=Luteithermobacter gelatinilyticus TaxID=2582913 RepID=UPI0011073B34|nr:GntR family transcriptional regulator [Luteithermobacter gelatinilyticus]|tara:strand:- start:295 stop:951 length:657 start_codon:yes stop_codon:yes gene_type:complete
MNLTISETICQQLAEQILSGTLAPGQKIEEQSLANQFSVSRTPVRDALRQLASTGLVEIKPRKGVTVVDLNIDQLTDMFEALVELEALCAKFSALRMSTLERKKLEGFLEEFDKALKRNDEKTYSSINAEFHAMIYRGCHNESLTGMASNLWHRLAPFRRSVFFKVRDRMKASYQEHRDIVDAILAADMNRAFEAMHNHVANSSVNAMEYLNKSKSGA